MNTPLDKAQWISAHMSQEDRSAPVFVKKFTLNKSIKSAEAYICGLGLFEMEINGSLPDDSLFNPAHTQYSSRVLYRVFDVTALLKEENEIRIQLGHGFFNEPGGVWNWEKASWRSIPKLLFSMLLTYSDGSTGYIVSDDSWLATAQGNIVFNSVYAGETYDASIVASEWKNAQLTTAPEGTLALQDMPPIRRLAHYSPLEIERKGEDCFIVTSPLMLTGFAKIHIDEPAGTEVTISYCEQLDEKGFARLSGRGEGRDGTWWPDYYIQQDKFISGGFPFDFEPKFSYKGFKYIQIDGIKNLKKEDITLYLTANDVSVTGEFSSSSPLINDLHALMKRTLLNNFQGKPTDTPVWEKNGWLGDASCGLLSMLYNFDMSLFLKSFTDTMADCFREFGDLPVMVPSAAWFTENNPVWNTVFVFAAESLIDFYGMTEYVRELYPVLRDFAIKDIEDISRTGMVWGVRGLADWVAPIGGADIPANPDSSEGAEICATAFIYGMLRSMVKISRLFGKTQDTELFNNACEKIYKAFNDSFFNNEKGFYETHFWEQKGKRTLYRQTSNLVPLYFSMVPGEHKCRVLENLEKDIISKNYHLDTGCTGTKMILPVLFDNGLRTTAYRILMQDTYPSWGYWLKKGDTSAWECWEDDTRSKNHYFLGTYEEALFSRVAGIRNIENGFSRFTIKPEITELLDNVHAQINTPHGKISVEWKKSVNDSFTVTISVPENTQAEIILCVNNKEIRDFLTGATKKYKI